MKKVTFQTQECRIRTYIGLVPDEASGGDIAFADEEEFYYLTKDMTCEFNHSQEELIPGTYREL